MTSDWGTGTNTRSRIQETIEALARIGATPGGGVTRLSLSDEDREARDLLAQWMSEAGLSVHVDDAGNMYGRREGDDPDAAPLLFGSHLDSVIKGGRFDGPLGVAAALEVMRAFNDAGVRTARPLVIVNWTDEEGARFQPGMLGSGVAAGRFSVEYAYEQTDAEGKTFGAELERIGYRGEASARPKEIVGYLELHIEQGPVLEELGAQIGAVEGIQGISWWRWRVTGRAGHAGTTPMDRRRDALVAAAECVLALNRLPERIGGNLVTTVGVLQVSPGGINIIPDVVEFTLDVRAPRSETLDAARAALEEIAAGVRGRGFGVSLEEIAYHEPTRFAAGVVETVERVAQERGLRTHRMWSGAGHDAMHMAALGPAAMIFVPCRGGISHAEDESITWEAAAEGAQVLMDAVVELAG